MNNTKIPGTQLATLKIKELETARTFENKHFIIKSVKRDPKASHQVIAKNKLIEKTVIFFNQNKAPFRIKVSQEFAEYWKSKQQAKRDLKAYYNKCTTDQLSCEVLMSVINSEENKFRSGISTYWAGYARGIREQRNKAKETTLSAFELISADDVTELSYELEISEDKLTSAVLEVISKRENGGRA